MGSALDAKKVKSAKRVLEVFEFFTSERQTATVMEIAREYDYPQSSTSQLLGCLVELGFLHRDRYSRTYRPTVRVATLGAWVQPRLFRNGALLPMMDELAEDTGSTVLLAGVIGVEAQVFHSVAPKGEAPIAAGATRSLITSAVGKSLLSTHDRQHVRKLVHRLNADAAPELRVRAEELLVEIEQIRRQGFAFSPPAEDADGMCVIMLPQTGGEEPLALALEIEAGEAQGADAHVRALRNAVASHLGPVLAHSRTADEPMRQAL